MLSRTTLIPNSSAQGHRLPRSTFNIAYSANHSSCRNCLRQSCTLSGAVHRTVRSRMEKADATTFCSQFDLQISTWFDHSEEDSSRTVSYLVRRLRAALRSSSSLQLHVPSSSLIQQVRNINRHSATVSRVQQCRTPSANCTKSCSDELLSTLAQGSAPVFKSVNNVELHRQPTLCMPSPAMSNSIDKSFCHHNGASVQQCRTPSTIQADPSCVQS